MKEPICTKHPRYTATMPPRSGCQACWLVWLAVQIAGIRGEIEQLWRRGDGY